MKVVVLAGGEGIRMYEETAFKPKPLIEIGPAPILWHIMKLYSHYGFNDFVVCLGYKGYQIKEYFLNYHYHLNDFTIDLKKGSVSITRKQEPWKITLVDTGEHTETGGRLKRIQKYIKEKTFLMTYSDGLTDANINSIIDFHDRRETFASVLAPNSPSKFGILQTDGSGQVIQFGEKITEGSYINGGFFVLDSRIFNYLRDDSTSWEYHCLPQLVQDQKLSAYKYDGFWKCMDSLKDKDELCKMWDENKAPWKVW